MKKVLLAALASLGVVSGAAHAQDAFVTGMDANFPPMSMVTLSGGIEGYFVDVAEEVARRLGKDVTIEAAAFSGLIPGLASGKYDWLVPTTVTAERAENLIFTEGFIDADFQFIVKTDSPDIETTEGLAGKKIAVNKGSIFDRWCEQNAKTFNATCEVYDTTTDGIQALLANRVDTAVASDLNVKWLAKQNPLVKSTLTIKTGQVYGLSTRKDRPELRDELSMAIKCMKQDGTLATLYEKWLGVAPDGASTINNIEEGTGVPDVQYDETPVEIVCG